MLPALILALQFAQPPAALSDDSQALLDQARALPPELAARALLEHLHAGLVPDDDRRPLLSALWNLARQARQPYPLVPRATPPPSSLPAQILKTQPLELDALSLQLDIADTLRPLDEPAANALLLEATLPASPAACSEALAPDPSSYFFALQDLEFDDILRGLARATTPALQTGARRFIAAWPGPAGERDRLLAALPKLPPEPACSVQPNFPELWTAPERQPILTAIGAFQTAEEDQRTARLQAALRLIAAWPANPHPRFLALTTLHGLTAGSPLQTLVSAQYLDLLADPALAANDPDAWLYYLQQRPKPQASLEGHPSPLLRFYETLRSYSSRER